MIHDLPSDERPREKLLAHGAAALSNAELLAIFIRTGLPGKSAIEIATELLQSADSLTALRQLDASHLASQDGLGPAKAAQIVAAFELGYRATQEHLKSIPLTIAPQIYEFASQRLAGMRKESLQVICLNSRGKFSSMHEISRGTIDMTIAHPRDILQPVISHNAASFIVIHNHPSGEPLPSRADDSFTETLVEAAKLMEVPLVDHMIIGRPLDGCSPYYSYAQALKL